MDSRGILLVTGLSDATKVKPFVMEIIPKTGKPLNYVFLEKTVEDDFTEYITSSGIHFDERDPRDGRQYYYMTFVYNFKQIQIVKVDRSDGTVKWNYQYES